MYPVRIIQQQESPGQIRAEIIGPPNFEVHNKKYDDGIIKKCNVPERNE